MLRKSSKVSYLPYVQSPIKALKNIDASVSEIFVDSLKNNFNIPKTDILIVNLNDAEESESRVEMLKRHGMYIQTYCNVQKLVRRFYKEYQPIIQLFLLQINL